jgi:hypothetical protein
VFNYTLKTLLIKCFSLNNSSEIALISTVSIPIQVYTPETTADPLGNCMQKIYFKHKAEGSGLQK